MAIETLQATTLGTVRDTTVSGNGVYSAFENLGLNVAGALAGVGIAKLAQAAGTQAPRPNLLSPSQYSQNVPPVHKTNWGMFAAVTVGLAAIAGLVVYAARTQPRHVLSL